MEKLNYIGLFEKELSLRNYSSNTINCYCSVVKLFIDYFKKSPQNIFESEIKDYILNYKSTNTKSQQIGALKLFYKLIVKQPLKFRYIEYPRRESKLPNLIRHCCFSHMIESGIDISIVQEIAGHNNPKTTDIYKHLSNRFISNIVTPLESW